MGWRRDSGASQTLASPGTQCLISSRYPFPPLCTCIAMDEVLEPDLSAFLTQVEQWGSRSDLSRCSPRRLTAGLSELNVSLTQPAMNLKDYQIEGVEWLLRKEMASVNCILADEMGLGKTIQSVSFLACLNHRLGCMGRHLVIAPKSVLPNWLSEFQAWYPQARVFILHSTKLEKEKSLDILKRKLFDVCLLSYEGVTLHLRQLKKIHWKVLIVDEAHRIKNPKCCIREDILKLSARYKILLTGTPMQMNMTEMWSLLNFLAPDLFSSQEQFEAWFKARKGEDSTPIVKRIRSAIEPFILRRLKSEVEPDMPIKREILIHASLTPLQRSIYKTLLSKPYTTALLMHLRKVCNHPYLFPQSEDPTWPEERLVSSAGKLKILDKLLPKLKAAGSKVLLFSQMTRLLDIIEDYCELRKYSYLRLDGSTSLTDRTEHIRTFNQEKDTTFLFLLSTRAGGLGVNLVSADTVILYDSDWNPQSDLQAMDRAHRIGQTKQVNVIRLVTKGTIEEKMIERQLLRLKLSHLILQKNFEGCIGTTLGEEEVKDIIAYGADAIVRGKGEESEDILEDDLDVVLMRGEHQAKLMEDKVEEAIREKEQVLENFEQLTNFFTFESTSAPVPSQLEEAESREYSLLVPPKETQPHSEVPDRLAMLISPSRATTTDMTVTATPDYDSIDDNNSDDNEDSSPPTSVPRRRSPSPAQGTKRFRAPKTPYS